LRPRDDAKGALIKLLMITDLYAVEEERVAARNVLSHEDRPAIMCSATSTLEKNVLSREDISGNALSREYITI